MRAVSKVAHKYVIRGVGFLLVASPNLDVSRPGRAALAKREREELGLLPVRGWFFLSSGFDGLGAPNLKGLKHKILVCI